MHDRIAFLNYQIHALSRREFWEWSCYFKGPVDSHREPGTIGAAIAITYLRLTDAVKPAGKLEDCTEQ